MTLIRCESHIDKKLLPWKQQKYRARDFQVKMHCDQVTLHWTIDLRRQDSKDTTKTQPSAWRLFFWSHTHSFLFTTFRCIGQVKHPFPQQMMFFHFKLYFFNNITVAFAGSQSSQPQIEQFVMLSKPHTLAGQPGPTYQNISVLKCASRSVQQTAARNTAHRAELSLWKYAENPCFSDALLSPVV